VFELQTPPTKRTYLSTWGQLVATAKGATIRKDHCIHPNLLCQRCRSKSGFRSKCPPTFFSVFVCVCVCMCVCVYIYIHVRMRASMAPAAPPDKPRCCLRAGERAFPRIPVDRNVFLSSPVVRVRSHVHGRPLGFPEGAAGAMDIHTQV